jgi:hypothetical protein
MQAEQLSPDQDVSCMYQGVMLYCIYPQIKMLVGYIKGLCCTACWSTCALGSSDVLGTETVSSTTYLFY